ncbi:hypothetical protein CCHR01_04711 [Colletotrichum chrysophilum]|uniref:Uncharacterized protein n=1 Tax=Colletotrichum chrysophilum TaxID=1836956 RepID=A0AAD9AQK0_9PEZI|nr:hypothetical protein CCHR01_04711 [Colletotrichum chrysophilum]
MTISLQVPNRPICRSPVLSSSHPLIALRCLFLCTYKAGPGQARASPTRAGLPHAWRFPDFAWLIISHLYEASSLM